MFRISLKKGDEVKVLVGKDKGKTGKVVFVDSKKGKVTVEGINLLTRFQRPKKQGQKGQLVKLPAPLNPSKLMLICPRCGKPTRIAHEVKPESRQKMRVCKKCRGVF